MPLRPIDDAASFHAAVTPGQTPESQVLDFKQEYRWQKGKWKPEDRANQAEELCRDIAQFANTNGGTLLVGVSEFVAADGRRVAGTVCPLDDVDGLKQWIEQAIRNHLTPSTFSRSLDAVVLNEGTVLSVNVRPSLHLVAVWHPDRKNGIEYLYRTDHGKQWMNPDEVERHIMNGSRAMRIQLNRVMDEVSKARAGASLPVALTPPVKTVAYSGYQEMGFLETFQSHVVLKRASSTEHEVELGVEVNGRSVCVRVPHGLVSEAWTTSDGCVGLCLKAMLVVRDNQNVRLEPLDTIR